jgi:hypothetical protein
MGLENFIVRPVSGKQANLLQASNHYLKRNAQAMFAYGLFESDDILAPMMGCVIYGKPASPSLCIGICGPEESSRVIELTRLWIDDSSPRNAESFLIGASLRLLPVDYDIIVSYAEIGAGHRGIVYQATNFLYTGLSDAHVEWRLDGATGKHGRHLFDEHGGVEGAKKFYGERLQRTERGRKHRYIIFRGSKKRKNELVSKMRYKVQPYPKQ